VPGAPPPATDPVAPHVVPLRSEQLVTVVTTNGALFRGELIEKWPNSHVTLRLPTGEYRRVPWQYISRVSSDAIAAPTATTRVLFRSEHEAATLQRLEPAGTWFDVCRTPCAGVVAARGVYRVSGEGLRDSEPFTLTGRGQAVAIRTTRVGTRSSSVLGGILAIGGGSAAYVGLILLGTHASTGAGHDPPEEDDWEGAGETGAVMLLGGTAAAIVGLVTLLRNKTDVELVRAQSRGTAQPSPVRERAGFSIPLSKTLAFTERGLSW
jgi:hypothetical protein